jgi:hypothetical protein
LEKIFRLLAELLGQLKEKYFDYFVFNIVDYSVNCGLLRSGARRYALAQIIGNARGLDINSPQGAGAHTQDLRLRRYQQHGDPNNARGLDINSPRSAENNHQDLRLHRHQ